VAGEGVEHVICVESKKKKQNETLIFSKASKALDCFSQRICRTLMAVAGLSPPPCDYEAIHQRPDCFEEGIDVVYMNLGG